MKSRPVIATIIAAIAVSLTAGFTPDSAQSSTGTPESGAAGTTTYEVDPVHSTALFRVHHLGAGQFWGRFNDVTGTVTFDGSEKLAVDVAIGIESVDSNADGLDRHLKSADFFNVREHPTMTFKSSAARKLDDSNWEVDGTITIRGISKKLTTKMTWYGTADMGRGARCGFETTFSLKRSEFEVSYGVEEGFLGNDTRVVVSLEAVEKK